MIASIISFSMKNRLLVLLMAALLWVVGMWSVFHTRLDAIPDLSDVQVVVTTEYPGQNPEVVDQQVTYPLASAMLAVPGSTVVRGYSMFGQSFVYVLFADGTDIYWARSRVLESLNSAKSLLPPGVAPQLGPDATGVGWVYQYVLKTGYYSPDHPKGLWLDAKENHWYAKPADAPEKSREALVRRRVFDQAGQDPLTGTPLVRANLDLAKLRSLQDWYLRYPLSAVDDVSEVAAIGGMVKQYQVVLDPQKLQAYHLGLSEVMAAIKNSNNDVGGSVVEMSENEYMVRSRGYLQGLKDLALVPVGLGPKGTPVLLGTVATLQIGSQERRGVGDWNGQGEAVGGVIVARFGANAHQVIKDVKAKLFELEDGLPSGVAVQATYDRSQLINRAVGTLRHTLLEEMIVVGLVCILFLIHMRSELVAVFVVPSSVVAALLIMNMLGMNANIMSLGGIAISIGVVVDSAVIMVENGHKHLDFEEDRVKAGQPPTPRAEIMLAAAREVGPQLFFSLLIITVAFLPVFVLGGEAGRLFKPLAFTKTFAMGSAALLSITVIPVLMYYFITARILPKAWGKWRNVAITLGTALIPAIALLIITSSLPHLAPYRWAIAGGWALLALMLLLPQKIIHEQHSPISWVLQKIYEPFFHLAMKHPWKVIGIAVLALASTWYPMSRMGTEFMPPLDEGDLLYMPTTDPAISIGKSRQLLEQTDRLIKTFPEVVSVHGKIGRADTATDPAPLSMLETVVQLNPDHDQWRQRPVARFFDHWPGFLRKPLAWIWPITRPITTEELKFGWQDPDGKMHAGLNSVVSLPGMANAWPYPIENRINMLATGIKTPVGIKISGPDLKTLSVLAERAANAVRAIPGTVSAYPDRTFGGHYLDINIDREKAARYGLTTGAVQDVIQSAIGGMQVSTAVEGLERYPINVRYQRDFRDDPESLKRVLVASPQRDAKGNRLQIPLGQLANIKITPGAPMIRSENAVRTAWVFVDISDPDLGGYIAKARQAVAAQVNLPPGYSLVFSGQFEFWEKTVPRLIGASVLAIFAIVFLLYVSSRSWLRVGIVMLAVPFSLIGAFWFMWSLDFNLSLAVVIGLIALAGLDAETGMVMLLYLDTSFERFKKEGRMQSAKDLYDAVHDGAVKRIRPKAMTVAAAFIGLVPLLWSHGTGADTMRRVAAPMIGGLLISFVMELLVYPVIFSLAKRWQLRHGLAK